MEEIDPSIDNKIEGLSFKIEVVAHEPSLLDSTSMTETSLAPPVSNLTETMNNHQVTSIQPGSNNASTPVSKRTRRVNRFEVHLSENMCLDFF